MVGCVVGNHDGNGITVVDNGGGSVTDVFSLLGSVFIIEGSICGSDT
jgi:hypothetical protein